MDSETRKKLEAHVENQVKQKMPGAFGVRSAEQKSKDKTISRYIFISSVVLLCALYYFKASFGAYGLLAFGILGWIGGCVALMLDTEDSKHSYKHRKIGVFAVLSLANTVMITVLAVRYWIRGNGF